VRIFDWYNQLAEALACFPNYKWVYMSIHVIRLKPGRERSVLRRHPWLFSGAIADVQGDPESGDTVDIVSHGGDWLARAAYSPHSQIRARIWTWDPGEGIGRDFFKRRLKTSCQMRQALADDPEVTAYREVHAESDGLPGLIVDRYERFRVIQLLSAGAERWQEVIVDHLKEDGGCEGIYERSDVEVRQLEGLSLRAGTLWGEEPEESLTISEYGLQYRVDIVRGQKTGFYLDQRENRRFVQTTLTGGEVLNCFAYTGGFSVASLAAGAKSVLSIDTSQSALELARENIRLNNFAQDCSEWIAGDAFTELRRLRDRGRTFDVVILDPPRFAGTASQVQRAARGYKDINLLAFKLLRPGGDLFTFSCSSAVSSELFEKIVAGAALDAGVTAQIVAWLGQPYDHPVLLTFPEGRYLKGLVCRLSA
jgi:23S rRNA (cytosine1962-C5)-methyltransferase